MEDYEESSPMVQVSYKQAHTSNRTDLSFKATFWDL